MKTIMKLDPGRLLQCRILRRVNRFTVLTEVNGTPVEAHINNTGRLTGVLEPGRTGVLLKIQGRRLRYRLLGVLHGECKAVVVDTNLQEKAFIQAVEAGLIPWLAGCRVVWRNRRIRGSVIDYVLECGGREIFVELKSAVMVLERGEYSGYPDAPTERGRRQIALLGELAAEKAEAMVVFISSVPGAKGFMLYCGIDREIGGVVEEAASMGVVFKAISIYFDACSNSIVLENPDLPVDLKKCMER